MTFKYVNRKNLIYYLHEKKNEDGTIEYFFSKQSQKNSIESLPEGYKIHEDDGGKITLKKILVQE